MHSNYKPFLGQRDLVAMKYLLIKVNVTQTKQMTCRTNSWKLQCADTDTEIINWFYNWKSLFKTLCMTVDGWSLLEVKSKTGTENNFQYRFKIRQTREGGGAGHFNEICWQKSRIFGCWGISPMITLNTIIPSLFCAIVQAQSKQYSLQLVQRLR